jgi:4-amino-4-deoxy-L-arabinose transferase-like glycosyltransferase
VNFRLAAVALSAIASYLLYFRDLSTVGFLSVDEPRYASIGRDMARSGDWITPRLWGEVWLEKPPLLYWTIAAATGFGRRDEIAARLPIALLAVGFLIFYWFALRRAAGTPAASIATAILATSAGFMAYSSVAVTDLPVAVLFASAMLLAMPWATGNSGPRRLPLAGALLGLAVLTKALLPVIFAAPILWWGRRRLGQLLLPLLAMVAVAAPWYAVASARHGRLLIDTLFLRHQVDRFFNAGAEVLHPQPWWFFLPVVLAGLLPWTPLLPLAFWREARRDPIVCYCASVFIFGFIFLSLSLGKLPGYILPLLPFLTAVIGIAASRRSIPATALATSAAIALTLAFVVPFAPAAIEYGIGRATLPPLSTPGFFFAAALAAALLLRRIPGDWRLVATLFLVLLPLAFAKHRLAGILEDSISARKQWSRLAPLTTPRPVCENWLRRHWLYGFNYYRDQPLPRCPDPPPDDLLRIESDPESGRPLLVDPATGR